MLHSLFVCFFCVRRKKSVTRLQECWVVNISFEGARMMKKMPDREKILRIVAWLLPLGRGEWYKVLFYVHNNSKSYTATFKQKISQNEFKSYGKFKTCI